MTTLVWVFLIMALIIGIFIGFKLAKWVIGLGVKKLHDSYVKEINELKRQIARYDAKYPYSP